MEATSMTPQQIHDVVSRVQERLTALGRPTGADLRVDEEGTYVEDGWLYVSVGTPRTSIRVSDYAEVLSEIEKELRADSVRNVLLVPARGD